MMETKTGFWAWFFRVEASLAFMLAVSGMSAGALIGAVWSAIAGARSIVVVALLVPGALLGALFVARYRAHSRTHVYLRAKHIANRTVRLVELADEHGWVVGRLIEGCTIYGPGVLMTYKGDNSTFDGCEWLPTGAPNGWAVAASGTDPAGSVRLKQTTFRNCRLCNIGINTGPVTVKQVDPSEGEVSSGQMPADADLERFLLTSVWRHYFQGSKSKIMRFGKGGLILTGANQNEATWRLEQRQLVFLRSDGTVHNRFAFNLSEGRFRSTNSPDSYAVLRHRIRDQYLERTGQEDD